MNKKGKISVVKSSRSATVIFNEVSGEIVSGVLQSSIFLDASKDVGRMVGVMLFNENNDDGLIVGFLGGDTFDCKLCRESLQG